MADRRQFKNKGDETIHATAVSSEFVNLKARLKKTWMAGDYDRFSRYMENGARDFYERLCARSWSSFPGRRLWLRATRSDCRAGRSGGYRRGHRPQSGRARARERAQAEGFSARFEEADAEALPFEEASFDIVASLVGAMFAPRPDLVAQELLRVCSPGGTIAMVNWTPQGFIGQMFKAVSKFIAPSGMPAPVLWGDEATVRERLGEGLLDLSLVRRHYTFSYPFPPSEVVEFFRLYYGPIHQAFASLNATDGENLRRELEALWISHNRAGVGCTTVFAEYLEVIGVRA
jgi:SAM-dependent methyltransferase